MKQKAIDLNSLLMGANVIVIGLTVIGFFLKHSNEYVNEETIVLAILLCIQTHVALFIERRRRDPFVILLAFEMILYYSLRVFTLTLYPFSGVFDRFQFAAGDSNYALVFILLANVFLYAGFYVVRISQKQEVDAGNWRATSPSGVVFLLLAAILFSYFSGDYWTEENIPRALNFFVMIFSAGTIILIALPYYFLFRESLSRKFALAIAVLIVVDMAVHTLTGSRSAIVTIVQNLILVGLALAGCIKVRRKYLTAGLALSPLIAALLVGSFAISTFNRANKEAGTSFNLGRAVELARQSSSELSIVSSADLVLPPMFSRAGFFDFSAEIIAHRDEYSSVINLPTYARSIVDNILTPGFDVFDQPKVSNSLQFIYNQYGVPSKQQVPDMYQSDQLGIYGESYALFGYASLPLLFLVALLLKRAYCVARARNPFVLVMKRVVVLSIFVEALRSFGVDWIILDVIALVTAFVLFSVFFRSSQLRSLNSNSAPERDHTQVQTAAVPDVV